MKNKKIKIGLGVIVAIGLAGMLWRVGNGPEPVTPAYSRSVIKTANLPHGDQPQEAGETAKLVAQMRQWRAITDKDESDRVEMAITDKITDQNAADFVRGLPPELLQTPVGLRALERWTRLDQRTAVEWLATQDKPTPFQISTALRGWVGRNGKEASDYAEDLPAGPWKESVLAGLSWDAVQSQEPLEAIKLARQMAPGETQARLLEQATQGWAQGDPEAASGWVSKVADPALKQKLIGATALGYAATEPKAATEWLRQSLPPGEALNQAVGNVVAVWVSDLRPADAAAWVARQPEGGLRDAAVAKLVEEWRQVDPGAVSAWIKALPAGPLQKQASDRLAEPLYPVRLAVP